MYQNSYAEILEDDQTEARAIEVAVLDRAVHMLQRAADLPHPSRAGVDALYLTSELWMTFMRSLAAPDNALPREVRAGLISIGIWILKEIDAIRQQTSSNYSGVADVCAIVRDGLR